MLRSCPYRKKVCTPEIPLRRCLSSIARLRQLGDLPSNADVPANSTVYEGAVVDAVKHFQRRHGLDIDGVLGKGTVTQLNVPLKTRVQQLQLTLERYRWIPPDFPEPPIVVNIPEFRLHTMRRQPANYLTMKVIVGRAMRTQTPVFANNMRYVIFRPYWLVPTSIQRDELVPKARRDPDYLADHGFEVVDGSGDVVPSSPATDDVISGLRSGALSIRQLPGPKNALGLVKFIFPNQYNVYLHGTPAPGTVLAVPARLQSRMHPGRRSGRSGGVGAARQARVDGGSNSRHDERRYHRTGESRQAYSGTNSL